MEYKKGGSTPHRTRESSSKSRKTEERRSSYGNRREGAERREKPFERNFSKDKPFEKFYKKEKPFDRIEREIIQKAGAPSHRGEIFTERFSTGKQRTYFFNVKENRLGDLFLNIVESKESENALGFERHQVVIFKEDLPEFLQVFNRAVDAMHNPDKKRVKIVKKK